eukprot:359555-Chlamydomonas_euryale.AAC.5
MAVHWCHSWHQWARWIYLCNGGSPPRCGRRGRAPRYRCVAPGGAPRETDGTTTRSSYDGLELFRQAVMLRCLPSPSSDTPEAVMLMRGAAQLSGY